MEKRAEARSRTFTPLSRMSAWRIRERKQPTASLRQLYAYLIACEVPEEQFGLWAEAWHRVRRYEAAGKTVSTDAVRPSRRVNAADAIAVMREAGLEPLDPFPGSVIPWTARCRECGQISRVKYAKVKFGTGCRVCAARRPAA
jgi:hypothetical protein